MTDLTGWLEEFASTQRGPGEIAEWVASTAEAVHTAVDLPADLHALVRDAVEQHWLAFLDGVTSDVEADDALVPAAHDLAVDIARHHLGLPVLLKIYQAAQEASWDYAVGVVGDASADLDHAALLVWFWTKANRWFSTSVERSVAVFTAETDRIRRRGDTQRYEVVAALLAGDTVGQSELSAQMGGHPITGVTHLALIAHAMNADSLDTLEPAITDLASRVPGARLAFVRPGGRELWAWISTRTGQVTLPAGPLDATAVRITVGGPAAGVDGFISAHRDARTAQRVALSPARTVAVTRYGDVTALTLLALDHSAAQRFCLDVLGGLGEPGHAHLRDTVRTVLTSSANADAVARKLSVHKNTVRYRIQQAERLLGRPLATRAGDLLLALDYHEAFLDGGSADWG